MTDETKTELMRELYFIKNELSFDDLQEYHQYLKSNGIGLTFPSTLTGLCLKDKDLCKVHKEKFVCNGCGRVWVPGSLADPACKIYSDPSWLIPELKLEWEELINKTGGVSKTDPLIILESGAHRHGRSKRI